MEGRGRARFDFGRGLDWEGDLSLLMAGTLGFTTGEPVLSRDMTTSVLVSSATTGKEEGDGSTICLLCLTGLKT